MKLPAKQSTAIAQRKLLEAQSWWDVQARAYATVRRCLVLYQVAKSKRDQAVRFNNANAIKRFQEAMDEAHDLAVTHRTNIETAGACARSAEISARVYHEE